MNAAPQKSEAWFKARVGVITGSRVGSIIGVNPYQTANEVMRDMVRETFGAEKEFNGNAATNHGERMEPIACAFYEKITGNKVFETGIIMHDDYPWLGASPDGLISTDGGLEIKCPYWAKEPYSVHDKPSYYAQCQHVMEVCGLDWMDFFCYISEDVYLHERLEREDGWFKKNLPIFEAFHKEYLEIIADEEKAKPFLQNELSLIKDARATRMSDLYLKIKEAEKGIVPLKEEFDALKKELGEEFGSFRTGKIKVLRVEKKGAVDHAAVYMAVGVEALLEGSGKSLDEYRKEPIVSYNVTPVKEK